MRKARRMTDHVDTARRALGPVGAFLPHSFGAVTPIGEQRAAVRRLEGAGYRAAWVNEVPGKDALVQAGVLLAATERLVLGTGIANVWVRPPQTMNAAAAQLAEAYPGRFVLGIGVGHPQQAEAVGREFGRPLATMRAYLTAMDAPTTPPAPAAPYPRILGAIGPKMLALAAEAADGALPAMVPPETTAAVREALGPEKLLAVFVDTSADDVPALVRAHLAAGADHVMVMPRDAAFGAGIDRLVALAPSWK
jgi:probable F420-dependent oxidoreductase